MPMLPRLAPLFLAATAAACSSTEPAPLPWEPRAEGWRTDPLWYDGKAEAATYEATRTIYGIERRYLATAYTNKQRMDEGTTTKAEGQEGVEVFKHHWSERVPTERYDYDFSTAVFCRTDDLAPWKLTAATQEDCGASFKLVWRAGDGLAWLESVYFPGGGLRQGRLEAGAHLADALPLVLRDFPFDEAEPSETRALALVPSQKDTHRVPFEPLRLELRYEGREELDLPIGRQAAQRLALCDGGEVVATYWFAADGGAPWLHALLCYEGPGGVTYRLKEHRRTAYWER